MMKKRVAVAMSGGVDSTLSALLLQRQGYEVIGITMKVWSESNEEKPSSFYFLVEDAKRVAQKLKIPHYLLNLQVSFEKEVIQNFCLEYLKGRTPNPCIVCNQKIKFGSLLKKAKELGADYLATGHYARIEHNKLKKRYILKKGKDLKKDQSYFLFSLSQDQLKSSLFPLGDWTKDEVKKMAKEFNLRVPNKKGSQEICFIPDNDYHKFFKKRFPQKVKPGPILDKEGNIQGYHQGIPLYTVGQRRGLGISSSSPLYVLSIEAKKNALIVGEDKDLYRDSLIADKLNFVSIKGLTSPLKVKVRIRYIQKEAEAVISPLARGRVKVKFLRPQRAITPGQSVVFYDQDIVLGGGIIE